jgi:uncharacterized repeat protein (TIGR04138 family)
MRRLLFPDISRGLNCVLATTDCVGYISGMPPSEEPTPSKSLDEIVEELGLYSREAFEFVRLGLNYTVTNIHGEGADPQVSRHVSGAQLSEGLRDYALKQWGLLARTVLRRWGIQRTDDFGRIVFTLVDNGFMSKTDDDTMEDFKNVYDFATAFDAGYRIGMKSP